MSHECVVLRKVVVMLFLLGWVLVVTDIVATDLVWCVR